MSLFSPTLYRRRITDVTVEDLRRLGVQGVLLDVDNTLTTHDAPELDARVLAWLDEMRQQFTLVIVSNNSAERVAPFAAKIGLPFHALARKPLPGGFWEAGAEHRMAAEECVVIGDQIFTDVLAARFAGIRVALVPPIKDKTTAFWRIKRALERPVIRKYARKHPEQAACAAFWLRKDTK